MSAWETGGAICGYLSLAIIVGAYTVGLYLDWREDRYGRR